MRLRPDSGPGRAWETDSQLAFDWQVVWASRHELGAGLLTTLVLATFSLAVSIVPAALVAVTRELGPRVLALALAALVTAVRAVPSMVVLVFVFFALPFLGITLDPFPAVAATLTCVHIVYLSEVFRGALAAVGRGQLDATRALGLGILPTLTHVVGPQSLRVAMPAFASSTVQLVHNTTLASLVTLPDLLGAALDAQALSGNPAPLLAVVPVYWLMLLPLTWLTRRAERRKAPDDTWIASPSSS